MTKVNKDDLNIKTRFIADLDGVKQSDRDGGDVTQDVNCATNNEDCETQNNQCINLTDNGCIETQIQDCVKSINNPCVSNLTCNDSQACNDTVSQFMVCCDLTQDPDKDTCDCLVHPSVGLCPDTQMINCVIDTQGACYEFTVGCPETEMCLTVTC